jgi:hypothetical protein
VQPPDKTPEFVSASQLISAWHERDDRYARWKQPLTADQKDNIRWCRNHEIKMLPLEERAAAQRELESWNGPLVVAR